MAEDLPLYQIEFYEDEHGNEPALTFMQNLSPPKRRAIGVAMNEVLAHLGPNVVENGFGKNLGGGLYEFRLDQDAAQIVRRVGKDPKAETDPEKILLRVFFHVHGTKVVLLLSGYDKGERTSGSYQNEQIERARGHLKRWKSRH